MLIGILTYHSINNYGAQLQAASSQNFLAKHGYTAEIVDFRPFRGIARELNSIIRPIRQGELDLARSNLRTNQMFRSSIASIALLSPNRAYLTAQVASLCRRYDVIICGSDELWNFANYLGYMRPYILDFPLPDTIRKVSYAASLGDFVPSEKTKLRMKASLEKFHRILVRDPTTLRFVNSLGLKATRVLDPTFLVDLPAAAPTISSYLMITGALSSAQVVNARSVAETLNLRPISVGYVYPGHEEISVGRVTPLQWIGYIRSADMHITSLFHGAAFSLKYRTPFAVYLTPSKEQKMISLVDIFNQRERLVLPTTEPAALAERASLEFEREYIVNFTQLVKSSQAAYLAAVAA